MAIRILSVAKLQGVVARGTVRHTIVDARPQPDFTRGHIPGALQLDWEGWCGSPPHGAAPVLHQPGYWGGLVEAEPTWYAERLSRCGLNGAAPIVVYADGVASKGREGRIAWMLLYLGARDVSILDGGWGGWLAGGGAVETAERCPERGHFTVQLQVHRRWTCLQLQQAYHAGTLPILVDTRTPEEFAGLCYDYLPRKGRLPTALLLPFADLFDGTHRYVRRDGYLSRLPARVHPPHALGVPPISHTPRLVVYCEVGVRASLAALLHEAYTGEVMAVFDGSLIEWALRADLPVDAPHAPDEAH